MFASESLIPADKCTICPATEGLTYVSLWPDWLKGNEYALRASNPFEAVVTHPQNRIPVCGEDYDFYTEACNASYFNKKGKIQRIQNADCGFPEGDAFSLACTVLNLPLMHSDGLTRIQREAMVDTHARFVDGVLRIPELQRELGLSDRVVESYLKAGFVVAENAPNLLIPQKRGSGRLAYLQGTAS